MPRPQKTITITLTRPIPPSVTAALDALREQFPKAFRQPPVALPEDILQPAHQALADHHSKKAVRRALAYWCGRTDYLRAVVAEGAQRVNLDGSDAGPVPEEQRQAALNRLDSKGVSAQAPPRPAPKPRAPRPPVIHGEADDAQPKVRIRQKPKLTRPAGAAGQLPTLSLRKRPPENP